MFIKEPKQKILVSFSGGETSAFMINWLLKNKPEYDLKFIFANTGEENEETLIFVKKCAEFFNIDITWVEYDDTITGEIIEDYSNAKGGYKIVDFDTAYRSHDPIEISNGWQNHPFRKYIRKFGIPNPQNMSCTRELKERPINRYMADFGWKPSEYDKAIGIRADELNRVGNHYYPLIKLHITKPMVNAFWEKMPFRLELKGWMGNCKVCWKKSIRKLITIARYHPEWFAFFKIMEDEYGDYLKPEREKQRPKISFPIRFFRENKSVEDIFVMAKDTSIEDAVDDRLDTNYQMSIYHDGTELDIVSGCVESCNAFN